MSRVWLPVRSLDLSIDVILPSVTVQQQAMKINYLCFSPQTSNGAILVHVEGELYKPIAAPLLQISTPPVNSVQLKDAQEKGPLPQPKQDIEMVHVKEHKPR